MENVVNTQASTTVGPQYTLTPEQHKKFLKLMEKEEKQKAYARRVAVKNQILLEKAKEEGIKVSKEEIDARIAKEDAKGQGGETGITLEAE